MLILFFIIVLILLLFLFIFAAYVAYRMLKPPRLVGTWSPQDLGYSYQEIKIKTKDSLLLDAWWIPKDSERTVIPLHGYTVSKWDQVYMKKIIKILLDAGYNVLTFDFRAHGKSEGKFTTTGYKEVEDLKSVIQWLTEKHPDKAKNICLIGYSMGASVALQWLSIDIPHVKCAICDSPPINMDATAKRGLKYFANLPTWIYYLVKPISHLMNPVPSFNMELLTSKIRVPLLLIAGTQDPLVKVHEVRQFYEKVKKNNPAVYLWVTDGAHVRSLQKNPEEYRERVLRFLAQHL